MIPLTELKEEIRKLTHLSQHEKMLEMCALLTDYLQFYNIKPIVVGGLSVEFYTRNNYTTSDIDLIMDRRHHINDLLVNELGFNKQGRIWYHQKLELAIEIPDNFLEGSKEHTLHVELQSGRKIYVIGIEDIIIHRLESALVSHPDNPDWTDDYEWAKRMYYIHQNDPDIMDKTYLKQAANKAQAEHIIEEWMKNT